MQIVYILSFWLGLKTDTHVSPLGLSRSDELCSKNIVRISGKFKHIGEGCVLFSHAKTVFPKLCAKLLTNASHSNYIRTSNFATISRSLCTQLFFSYLACGFWVVWLVRTLGQNNFNNWKTETFTTLRCIYISNFVTFRINHYQKVCPARMRLYNQEERGTTMDHQIQDNHRLIITVIIWNINHLEANFLRIQSESQTSPRTVLKALPTRSSTI